MIVLASIKVVCPAKINTFLSVGPPDRRKYHPLRTIFQAVGLCDTLWMSPASEFSFEIVGAELPAENTVSKTLRMAGEIAAIPPLRIRLEKQIPMQSGLGGGSSNAAGVLRGLCAMGLMKPNSEMASVASVIGADVPFFLVGGRARGEGYGDRLTALPDPKPYWLVVAKPEIGIPTAEAYWHLDGVDRDWQAFPQEDLLYNDFEQVAPGECLDVIEHLRVHGATDAGLSGSGSAVFGRFETSESAQRAADRLNGEFVGQAWVVSTLSRSQSLVVENGP